MPQTLSALPSRHAASPNGQLLFAKYTRHPTAWDELFDGNGEAHAHCRPLVACLGQLLTGDFQQRRASADLVFINQGITFSVYSDRRGVEKIFPFDLIPRPVEAAEWARIEAGLLQRITALNQFLHDVYHEQRILKEGIIPAELVLASKGFPQRPPRANLRRGVERRRTGGPGRENTGPSTRFRRSSACRCPPRPSLSARSSNRATWSCGPTWPHAKIASSSCPVAWRV